jgi:class 3 adenylate cyclase
MSSSQIERKLAAIMFTDIAGFTKIMGDDETTALSILENQQSIINPIVKEHKGTIIKKMGDGLLIEFPSTVNAVECATQMQDSIKSYNTSADNLEFHIRVGIHLGDVVILGDDILGDGVNIASRIEPLGSPDGICITDAVYQSVKSKLKLDAKRIDEVDLKHIDDKYTIYKIPNEESVNDSQHQKSEIDITRFEVNSIENKTNLLKEIKNIYLYWFCTFLLSFLMIGGTFLFTDWNEAWNEVLSFTGILGCAIFALLVSFPFSGRIYKLNFQDIRNVSSLLDILIMKMQFTLVKQTGNSIEYIHMPVTDMFLNKIKLTKYYPKTMKRFDTLSVIFDGNTVQLTGLWFHLFRLMRNLKKYYK